VGVALFHLFSHRVLDAVVCLMFLVGAALAIREAAKERQEKSIIAHEVASKRRVVTTAFIVIFLAEWGDLTQILTANMAANFHSPISVSVGALLALWAVAALAVIGGQSLLKFIKISTVRIATAVVLFVFAGIAGWSALKL
jgi:putative Ca2+/H+ antiporter (TMEM165/GDT1 family)